MKKEVADKWIDALRNGKYVQGTNRLKGNDSYCCLGVLCDISGLSEWTDGGYLGQYIRTPSEVDNWAGISNGKLMSELIQMNDRDSTFLEIADKIEQEWEDI